MAKPDIGRKSFVVLDERNSSHPPVERWHALSARLDEALELPEDERARWMEALRQQDPALADEVGAFLKDYESARSNHFLEKDHGLRPAAPIAAATASVTGLAGRTFGAYRLVSQLGQGGMGIVWLAERCQ